MALDPLSEIMSLPTTPQPLSVEHEQDQARQPYQGNGEIEALVYRCMGTTEGREQVYKMLGFDK